VVKCSEVLQCSDGPSDKVSNSVRRHIDNMKLLLIYSLGSIFFINIYMVVFLFNTVIYVFLLFYCKCVLYSLPPGGYSIAVKKYVIL
jgi:hypothetical protein